MAPRMAGLGVTGRSLARRRPPGLSHETAFGFRLQSTQTRSLPDGELNVWLRHKPPFRFWDRAMNLLMTEAGW